MKVMNCQIDLAKIRPIDRSILRLIRKTCRDSVGSAEIVNNTVGDRLTSLE